MKILILGKQGWIGNIFYNHLVSQGIETTYCHHDINSLQILEPDITHVVNFAASTSIDWCENNKNRTFWNNVLGAVNVAKVCKISNVKHVFVSSACIFESKNGEVHFEDSKPSPQCFYTESKLMAEKLTREVNPESLIVRPRLPISEVSHPRNTLNKLIKYPKLIDCQESITVVEDFVPRLLELIQQDAKGTYNIVNEGTISPADIGDLLGHTFERYTKSDLDQQIKVSGQANRVSTLIGSYHGYLPPIKDRIKEVVEKWKLTSPSTDSISVPT